MPYNCINDDYSPWNVSLTVCMPNSPLTLHHTNQTIITITMELVLYFKVLQYTVCIRNYCTSARSHCDVMMTNVEEK